MIVNETAFAKSCKFVGPILIPNSPAPSPHRQKTHAHISRGVAMSVVIVRVNKEYTIKYSLKYECSHGRLAQLHITSGLVV
jgi:hypothetical protein